MRRVTADRPFTAGMVTDLPATKIGAQNSVFAQDLIAPEGIARQRKGWVYDGTTADAADNLVAVHRNKYLLNDNTRTLTGDDDGDIRVHNSASSGTLIFDGSVQYLPRAVYRDEVLWCAQDGESPLVRYSGANAASNSYSGTPALTSGQATVTGQTTTGTPAIGSYFSPQQTTANFRLRTWHRVLESSTTSVTLENVLASAGESLTGGGGSRFDGYGYAFPCVPIYSAGTVVYTNGTSNVDGYGTKWSTGGTTIRATSSTGADGMLIMPSGSDPTMYEIITVTDDDDIQAVGGNGADVSTKSAYAILRRMPFKDVAVHKKSLWGTGVAQSPNSIYVGEVGWDISGPPRYIPPYDITKNWTSDTATDYVMYEIQVPSAYDGDVNIAILSSPNPLLVLKRSAVYGVFGSFDRDTFNGGLSVDKIADGVGCIDIRSAISGPNGQFWAGEDGIYAYTGGQVIDLTAGKINREWKALTSTFDFGVSGYCSMGECDNHLLVCICPTGGTAYTYVYDLANQAWISQFTNHKARYFFSSKVDGEAAETYWVGDNDQGRVMRSSYCFSSTGLAHDGDGDAPRMKAWTGYGLDGTATLEEDERLLDLSIVAQVYDTGAAGTTSMGVTVASGGALEGQVVALKALSDFDSSTTGNVTRKRYRTVNTKGRMHQVRLDVDTLGADGNFPFVEVHEISATFRQRRGRT